MGVYCRRCQYNLKRVTSGRCPECGQPFDPDNVATFRIRPAPPRWPIYAALGATAGAFVVGIIVAALIALTAPTDTTVTIVLTYGLLLGAVFALPIFVGSLGVLFFYALHRGRQRRRR